MISLPIKPDLALVREVVVAELSAAMLKAQRNCVENAPMPNGLMSACIWLADQAEFPACEAEEYFNWTPQRSLRFLYHLSPEARAQEVERGHRVLFVGNSRRAPLIDMSLTEVGHDPMGLAA